MKKSGITIIFIIGCIGVLFVAYVIGLSIRQVRFRRARVEPETSVQPQMSAEIPKPSSPNEPRRERTDTAQVPSERGPMSGQEGRRPFGGMTEQERAQLRERWENMTDEEREQERERRRAEMRERFGDRQFQGRGQGGEQRQNEQE